jgi:hypothetical protein
MSFDKKAIRERLENATPGPWRASHVDSSHREVTAGKYWICDCSLQSDTDFIAHAPTDLNAALAEIERLEARIAVKDTQLLSVIGKSGKEVQLETENARYRKALEFYTKDHLYPPSVSMPLLMQLMHVASEALNPDAK